jgi:hypothetical protein
VGGRGKTRFIDYFGLDEDLERLLRPHVVDFGIFLDDISKVAVVHAAVMTCLPLLGLGLKHATMYRVAARRSSG